MRAIIFLSILFCTRAEAVSLINRPQQLTSDLLPKQVWIFSYEYGSSSTISNQYNASGSVATLNSALSKNLDIADVVKNISNPTERALAQAAFDSENFSDNTPAGVVVNDLKINYSTQAYVLGYGVADFLSLFFVAPKVDINFNLNTSMTYSREMKGMIARLRADGQNTRADEIEKRRATVLGDQLANYNYSPDYVSNYSGIPSFHLVGRLGNAWMRKQSFVSETMLNIPNRQDQPTNQFSPMDLFENSLSITQGLYKGVAAFERIQLTGVTRYLLRTPFNRQMRVPESSDNQFSNDERKVSGKLGDEWNAGLQISRPTSLVTPFASIVYRQKFKDHYEASGVDGSRFDSLTNQSAQELTTLTLGANINTISLFLRNKFLIPVQMGVMYSDNLSGKNTFDNKMWAANLMVFYK